MTSEVGATAVPMAATEHAAANANAAAQDSAASLPLDAAAGRGSHKWSHPTALSSTSPLGATGATRSPRPGNTGEAAGERMYEMWKQSEARKEALRTQKAADELAQLQAPSISPRASALKRDPEIPVYQRLIEKYATSMERIEKERRHLNDKRRQEEDEALQMAKTGAHLTRYAQRLAANDREQGLTVADSNLQWEVERQKKLDAARKASEEEASKEVTGRPSINRRSVKLAAKQRPAGVRVEDHLLEYEQKRRLHLMQIAGDIDLQENPGHPRITEHAARLQRDGDPFERLYNMAYEIEDKKRERELAAEASRLSLSESPSHGGNHLGTGHYKIEDELLRKSEESKRKREELAEMLFREYHRRPRMNPASEEIAARLPISSRERLLSPKMAFPEVTVAAATAAATAAAAAAAAAGTMTGPSSGGMYPGGGGAGKEKELAECTFHPKINSASRRMDAAFAESNENMDRGEWLHQRSMQRLAKLEKMRQEQLQLQLKECTFKPKISASASASSQASQPSPGVVVDRLVDWKKHRDERMQQEREQKQQREMQECTFTPALNPLSLQLVDNPSYGAGEAASPSGAAGASGAAGTALPVSVQSPLYEDGVVPGLDEFLRRQEKARVMREQAKTIPHASGEGWTPELTVPIQPKFHTEERAKARIKSLRRPVSMREILLREFLTNGSADGGAAMGSGGSSGGRTPASGSRNNPLTPGSFSVFSSIFAAPRPSEEGKSLSSQPRRGRNAKGLQGQDCQDDMRMEELQEGQQNGSVGDGNGAGDDAVHVDRYTEDRPAAEPPLYSPSS